MTDSRTQPNSRRQGLWNLRFRLRTLLIFVTVFALIVAAHAHRTRNAQRQRAIVSELNGLGALTQYDYVQDENWNSSEKTYPTWLERWVGEDYLYSIDAFVITSDQNPNDAIELASELPYLRLVKLPACAITDESLRPLENLHRLEWLELFATPVTDECMASIAKLSSLKILDLRGTAITDRAIPTIVTGGSWLLTS